MRIDPIYLESLQHMKVVIIKKGKMLKHVLMRQQLKTLKVKLRSFKFL